MGRANVRLVSAEGAAFVVDFRAACVSNTIKNMLSSQGAWAPPPRPPPSPHPRPSRPCASLLKTGKEC